MIQDPFLVRLLSLIPSRLLPLLARCLSRRRFPSSSRAACLTLLGLESERGLHTAGAAVREPSRSEHLALTQWLRCGRRHHRDRVPPSRGQARSASDPSTDPSSRNVDPRRRSSSSRGRNEHEYEYEYDVQDDDGNQYKPRRPGANPFSGRPCSRRSHHFRTTFGVLDYCHSPIQRLVGC